MNRLYGHEIDGFLSLVVKSISIGALDKELLDTLRASVLLVGLHSEMQRCKSLGVLSIEISAPGDDVV